MNYLATRIILSSLVLIALSVRVAYCYDGAPAPKSSTEQLPELKDVGISEQIGVSLDLSTEFTDETGKRVKLSDFFHKGIPVVISPVYFNCPGLCNFHLNGFIEALKDVDWSPGKQFEMIALSFDSREKFQDAAAKKNNYLQIYGRPSAEKGWHFLTGSEESIKAFTGQVGFKFKWNETDKEWAHASSAIILTPTGVISRYLPGISFQPQDIRLALNEAAEGRLGTFVDRMVLYCFKYDNAHSKYTLYAFNLMKIGAALMVFFMMLWLVPVWIRARRQKEINEFKKAL